MFTCQISLPNWSDGWISQQGEGIKQIKESSDRQTNFQWEWPFSIISIFSRSLLSLSLILSPYCHPTSGLRSYKAKRWNLISPQVCSFPRNCEKLSEDKSSDVGMSCWLTIGSIPKLLFLLLPILLCAADFRAADLDSKSGESSNRLWALPTVRINAFAWLLRILHIIAFG